LWHGTLVSGSGRHCWQRSSVISRCHRIRTFEHSFDYTEVECRMSTDNDSNLEISRLSSSSFILGLISERYGEVAKHKPAWKSRFRSDRTVFGATLFLLLIVTSNQLEQSSTCQCSLSYCQLTTRFTSKTAHVGPLENSLSDFVELHRFLLLNVSFGMWAEPLVFLILIFHCVIWGNHIIYHNTCVYVFQCYLYFLRSVASWMVKSDSFTTVGKFVAAQLNLYWKAW
jgi:hypothetical protein